jgi:hypothetical protein
LSPSCLMCDVTCQHYKHQIAAISAIISPTTQLRGTESAVQCLIVVIKQ